MKRWTVVERHKDGTRAVTEPERVEADAIDITHAGALKFLRAGTVVRIIAPGIWADVVDSTPAAYRAPNV